MAAARGRYTCRALSAIRAVRGLYLHLEGSSFARASHICRRLRRAPLLVCLRRCEVLDCPHHQSRPSVRRPTWCVSVRELLSFKRTHTWTSCHHVHDALLLHPTWPTTRSKAHQLRRGMSLQTRDRFRVAPCLSRAWSAPLVGSLVLGRQGVTQLPTTPPIFTPRWGLVPLQR